MAKDKIENLVNRIFNESKVTEGRITYSEKHPERMLKEIEDALRTRNHSLGDHPAFPEGDEQNFEEQIISDRFKDVVKNLKKQLDIDIVKPNEVLMSQAGYLMDAIKLEKADRKELEELAVRMIREEYDIPEDLVDIEASLVDRVTLKGTKRNPSPTKVDGVEFESHSDLVNANAEVYKRRLTNAMIQGAAIKNNHLFHMVDHELSEINPRLPNIYTKTMAIADYAYYVVKSMENGLPGGQVMVEFPKQKGDKIKIIAEALIFPVLIQELSKGAMEVISAHGLPKNKDVQKYIINKADFLAAENWDIRLGSALWERFTKLLDANDFGIKHQVYMELISLPVEQFNETMKEIFAGTKKGKRIIKELCDEINDDLRYDNFNEALNLKRSEKRYFENPDELDDYL